MNNAGVRLTFIHGLLHRVVLGFCPFVPIAELAEAHAVEK